MRSKVFGSGYTVYEDGSTTNLDGSLKRWSPSHKDYMYSRFRLENGKWVTKSQHRLVAELFLDRVSGKNEVDHIDGDRKNNHVSNLRWVTHGENVQHSYSSGRRVVSGTKNANAVQSEDTIREVCKKLESGLSIKEVHLLVGVPMQTVRSVASGHQWSCISKDYNLPPYKRVRANNEEKARILEMVNNGYSFSQIRDSGIKKSTASYFMKKFQGPQRSETIPQGSRPEARSKQEAP